MGVSILLGVYTIRGWSMVRSIAFFCALAASIVAYQNCTTSITSVDQASVPFELTPECIGSDNSVALSVSSSLQNYISLECKRTVPIADTQFLDCGGITLDNDGSSVHLVGNSGVLFNNLQQDNYQFFIRVVQLVDGIREFDEDYEVIITRCGTTTNDNDNNNDNNDGGNTGTTVTTATTGTTVTTATTGTTVTTNVVCGQGVMSGHPHPSSSQPTCPTSQKTHGEITCYADGGPTCEQQRNNNVCTECTATCGVPTNKSITCGADNGAAGDATNYASSSRPTCVADEKQFCATTCYRAEQTCEQKRQLQAMPNCWECQSVCGEPTPAPNADPEMCIRF